MKKKLCLILALVFVFTSGLAFANNNEKIAYLQEKNIVQGRILEGGKIDLALAEPITRGEFSKIMAVAIDLSDEIPDFTFIDIQDHWAREFIDKLSNDPRGIITGYEDGYFRPDASITNAELAAMMVRAAKKDLSSEDKKNAIWPDSYVAWANELGLFQGLDIKDIKDKADRQTAFEMLYNTMAILDLDKNQGSQEFSEFDPATRAQSFDWIYNAMDKLGKVDHSTDVKDKINQIFGSPSIKKGDKLDVNIDITGQVDGSGISASSKISAVNSLLKPDDMALNNDFTKLTLTYSKKDADKLAGSSFKAYYMNQPLLTSFDSLTGQVVISTDNLVEVLSNHQTYPIRLVFQAGQDIE